MPRRVTIVMYHFVRDYLRTRYPEIKGLDVGGFIGQLEYIRRHYHVIRMEDLVAAAEDSRAELPPRSLLLTFDDGYLDHFQTVFPLLDEYGLQGSFFPPARAVLERKVLDVNKIHLVLASTADKARIAAEMEERIRMAPASDGAGSIEGYRSLYATPSRWDTAEVVYLKRVLQKGLPYQLRTRIVDELFRHFVSVDEAAIAEEMYVSMRQLQCMHRHGMWIGSHGHDHLWMDTLDPVDQEYQVLESRRFLEQVGCDIKRWVMCYPYGGFNESLTGILRYNGCRIGLTTKLGVADLDKDDPLELARLDTNDLPRAAGETEVRWLADG